jgi:5-methylcytosine-specific restriction endonuclease McrA
VTEASDRSLTVTKRWGLVHVWGTEASEFRLRRLAAGELDEHWGDGITPDVLAFLAANCRCTGCEAPIKLPLAPCACGYQDSFGELFAKYPRTTHEAEVQRLYARQKNRKDRVRRISVGGTLSAAEIDALFLAQEGICYYCACSLLNPVGSRSFHCDHFVSVTDGGRGDLENTVLSCSPCNRLKGTNWGQSFAQSAAVRRLVADRARLTKMRRGLAAWRRDRGLRPLGKLLPPWHPLAPD